MMKKKAALILALAMVFTMALTGCGGGDAADTSSDAQGLTDVTLAFCTYTGYAPVFIAKEKGFFEEEGINIDVQVIEDESTYASLITKGDVQFIATAQDPNIKMFANGADCRYVLTMDSSVGADGLVATADIKTLDDLKGKTLALDKSASSYYFFLTALENGSSITEADINVQDMGDTTEAGVAFIGGKVDAAIMWEPELSDALDEVEGAHAIVTSADYPDCISDSIIVNTGFAEEHPEVVEGMMNAWYKAVDYFNENPEESYEIMAGGFEEVTAEDVKSDCEGLKFYGKADNEAFVDESSESCIFNICQDMADFWMDKGECDTDVLDAYFELVKK